MRPRLSGQNLATSQGITGRAASAGADDRITGHRVGSVIREIHVPDDHQFHAPAAPCHLDSDSVICFGQARLLTDLTERAAALNAFNRRYRPAAADLPEERVEQCMAVEITIAEITGRRERDRHRTYWRATF